MSHLFKIIYLLYIFGNVDNFSSTVGRVVQNNCRECDQEIKKSVKWGDVPEKNDPKN